MNTHDLSRKNKKSSGRPTVGSDYKKAIVTLKTGDKIELVQNAIFYLTPRTRRITIPKAIP